jgi:hypothetical protein
MWLQQGVPANQDRRWVSQKAIGARITVVPIKRSTRSRNSKRIINKD